MCDSMPMLDDDFNYNEIIWDFLEPHPNGKSTHNTDNYVVGTPDGTTNTETTERLEIRNLPKQNTLACNFTDDVSLNFLSSTCSKTVSEIKSEKKKVKLKNLSLRISEVDALIRKTQDLEAEKKCLQKNLEDLQQSAKEVQLLYAKEKQERFEVAKKFETLNRQYCELETQQSSQNLENDQLKAQIDDCKGPIEYSQLVLRYLKSVQKNEEDRSLHWHDQAVVSELTEYCKKRNLKLPQIVKQSPPKNKKTKNKVDNATQCEIITTESTKKKNPILQRSQGTQCDKISTRNQACQHRGTTTTRGTTTSCFFKYHDVGTDCSPVDFEPAFSEILDEMRRFGKDFAPISPIAEIDSRCKADSQDKCISPIAPSVVELKTIGTCTLLCNVQRHIDFITQPVKIKRSISRPPSSLLFENVKNESNTPLRNVSPNNLNAINQELPKLNALLPTAFDELWQIFGHMLYGLLQRRNLSSSLNHDSNTPTISDQQTFYNWLQSLYVDVRQADRIQEQRFNSDVPKDPVVEKECSTHSELNSKELRSDSRNFENYLLNFSNAAPFLSNETQTENIVVKPKPQRSDHGMVEHKKCDESTTHQQSVGTSPIHFNDLPENLIEESSAPSLSNVQDLNGKRTQSAFETLKKGENLLRKTDVEVPEETNSSKSTLMDNKIKAKSTSKNCRLKTKRRIKPIKIDHSNDEASETAVDFIANLPNYRIKNTNDIIVKDSNSEFCNSKIENQNKPPTVECLQRKMNDLFGSDSECDSQSHFSDLEEIFHPKKYSISENFQKDQSASPVETLMQSSDEEEFSLKIDEEINSKDEKLEQVKETQNEMQNEKLEPIDNEVIQRKQSSSEANENHFLNRLQMPSTSNSKKHLQNTETQNKMNSTDLHKINFDYNESTNAYSAKRGRKRKNESDLKETFCKRSARLLAKQDALQSSNSTTNSKSEDLSLLGLDFLSPFNKNKRTTDRNVTDKKVECAIKTNFTSDETNSNENLELHSINTLKLTNTSTFSTTTYKATQNELNVIDMNSNASSSGESTTSSYQFYDSNIPSCPASPDPSEILCAVEHENIKNIPLDFLGERTSKARFMRGEKKSLIHGLINAYDMKQYRGFNAPRLSTQKETLAEQFKSRIIEYIEESIRTEFNPLTQKDAALNLINYFPEYDKDSKIMAQAIIMCIKSAPRPKIKPYENFSNKPIPTETISTFFDPVTNQEFSTQWHRSIAYILEHFNHKTFSTIILSKIETVLFNVQSSDLLSLDEVVNLTELYLNILQQQKQTQTPEMHSNPARFFIAKCFYYNNAKAIPMVYAALKAFPSVLPHREERTYDRSDPLITVIQHILMCTTYDMNNHELRHREMLSKLRFEYHFECFKPDFSNVLANLVEKLTASKLNNLKYAFAIFCKRLKTDRVISEIIQAHFIPLVNEYYRHVEHSSEYDIRAAALLDCFSTVIKPFPRDTETPIYGEVANYLNIFKRFLAFNQRPVVQEAAVHAILRLQRFNFVSCYYALANISLDFDMQPSTRAALRTFVYRKPFNFWKTLSGQNK